MSVPTITGRMERKIAEGGMEASDGMVWWKKFEPGSVQDARRREFCARL